MIATRERQNSNELQTASGPDSPRSPTDHDHGGDRATEIRVLPRGNWLDESGPVVQPAIPAFLGQLDLGDRRATRADLANWLTDVQQGDGGLTARVFANRFWYLLFGVGIARSLDDFGGQGEPPMHPELLDNLAVEFYESGWDVKHMMKLIVMSRAYRQSSWPHPNCVRAIRTIACTPGNRVSGSRPKWSATTPWRSVVYWSRTMVERVSIRTNPPDTIVT